MAIPSKGRFMFYPNIKTKSKCGKVSLRKQIIKKIYRIFAVQKCGQIWLIATTEKNAKTILFCYFILPNPITTNL